MSDGYYVFGGVLLAVTGLAVWWAMRQPQGDDEGEAGKVDGIEDVLDLIRLFDDGSAEAARLKLIALHARIGMFMAAADGTIDARELLAVKAFFEHPESAADTRTLMDKLLTIPPVGDELDRVLTELHRVADAAQKEVLLHALLSIVAADDVIHRSEEALFYRAATALGFSDDETKSLFITAFGAAEEVQEERAVTPLRPVSADEAYVILRVPRGATGDEIRAGHAARIAQLDDEGVRALGPEFVEVAAARRARVDEAHRALRGGA
jgi:uncharacterized tellurite resistance protein B-like protein